MRNGHTGGDGVGIDDDVGALAAFCEWHIHFWNNVSDGTLLSVTTAEFISDDRFTKGANADFANDVSVAVAFHVVSIDVGIFGSPVHFADVFVFDEFGVIVAIFLDGNDFPHDDVAVFDDGVFGDDALAIEFAVVSEFHSFCFRGIGFASDFLIAVEFLVLVFFGVVDGCAEQTAVDCALVYENTVFLVVAGVTHDCDDDGGAGWDFVEFNHTHDAGIYEGAHRVG